MTFCTNTLHAKKLYEKYTTKTVHQKIEYPNVSLLSKAFDGLKNCGDRRQNWDKCHCHAEICDKCNFINNIIDHAKTFYMQK